MLRLLRRSSLVGAVALALGFESALGFSLLAPKLAKPNGADSWQVNDLGFDLSYRADVGTPNNLGEEYRHNTPVMYYTFDANFLDYFGTGGAASVDQAFAVFNDFFNTYTNVDMLSGDLSEIPLETTRFNRRAEALGILDMKSAIMGLLIENLGLADPVRYTWNIHDRYLQPNTTCPEGEYYRIVKRNFDPVIGTSALDVKPSSYVNGVLYTYQVHDYCNVPAGVFQPVSEALEFPVDPKPENGHLPVAFTGAAPVGGIVLPPLFPGRYITGLTRDDAGGLRYLLSANNMNTESAGPNTVTFVTNTSPQLLYTSNLTVFAAQALTNDAPALQALYPGLITTATSFFSNVCVTASTPYFTNYPFDPIGTPPHVAFATNTTCSVGTFFRHTLGNVYSVGQSGNGFILVPLVTLPGPNGSVLVSLETIAVTNSPYDPVGVPPRTNTTTTTYWTNSVVGDFVIIPPGSCGFAIVAPQLTYAITYTNVLTAATVVTGTNVQSITQSLITYLTNRVFQADAIVCQTVNVGLHQGIGKVNFIRRDYDSLLTRFFIPVTNEYTLNLITGYSNAPQRVQRTVTAPDYLITAADITPPPPFMLVEARTIPNYNSTLAYPNLAGPGTIEVGTTFTFNKSSPMWQISGLVSTNDWLQEKKQTVLMAWGSFDGSTNPPVTYPTDLSINTLENQVLVQVNPQFLPDASLHQAYNQQLQAVSSTPNFQPPYSWSLAPGSPGLPSGLAISGSGLIYGAPTQSGFFDFMIQVTDVVHGGAVLRSSSIRVNP